MVDGFREGRARQAEASRTGDGCCAVDLAVRLLRIRQPGILLHHAPLPIVEEDPGSSSLISGVGEKRKEEGHIGNAVSGSGSVVEVSMYRRMTVRLSRSVGSRT